MDGPTLWLMVQNFTEDGDNGAKARFNVYGTAISLVLIAINYLVWTLQLWGY